jgi:type VI secretion system secreted protein Hcp
MAGDMFIKFEGGKVVKVKGEATAKDHEDWLDIESFSWGVSQTGTMGMGTGGGAGKAHGQDIVISKRVDRATPNLFASITTGNHFDKATIEVRKAGGSQMVYYQIVLEHVFVTSLNNAGGGDLISESFSLNFASMALTYYPQADQGSQEGAVEAKYNYSTQEG